MSTYEFTFFLTCRHGVGTLSPLTPDPLPRPLAADRDRGFFLDPSGWVEGGWELSNGGGDEICAGMKRRFATVSGFLAARAKGRTGWMKRIP